MVPPLPAVPPWAPPADLRQEAWDTAATLASQGLELPVVVSKVLYAAGPRIDLEAAKAVPPRGRTFWVTMATALVWVVAVYLTFVVFESGGTHAVPALKLAIYIGVLVWAVGFGVVAANHKVRERRGRVGAARRAVVEELARDAARRVWASQVAGSWQPLGPAPVGPAAVADTAPAAWLRRFGSAPGDAVPLLVDGTKDALLAALRSHPGRLVVPFVREPGFFSDAARELAEEFGIALFVFGRSGLVAMSGVASAVLKAYQSAEDRGPAEELARAWAGADRPSRAPLRRVR